MVSCACVYGVIIRCDINLQMYDHRYSSGRLALREELRAGGEQMTYE